MASESVRPFRSADTSSSAFHASSAAVAPTNAHNNRGFSLTRARDPNAARPSVNASGRPNAREGDRCPSHHGGGGAVGAGVLSVLVLERARRVCSALTTLILMMPVILAVGSL